MVRGKKNTEDKDNRMIADYFKELNNYYQKYGEKTILLWQCGSFYEIYCVQDPNTGKCFISKFDDYLSITHMRAANKHITYKYKNINMPVKMAGFTATEYFLNKYTTVLVNEGFTVAVWHENGIIGKKKTRSELHVFSPGTNFSVEKKEDTNIIACYVIMKNDKGFINKNPSIIFGCSAIDIFTGNVKLFEYTMVSQNIHNPTIFDELERFNSIYNPIETIIIHNYKNEQKINDIIQFAALQTKSIHIVNQIDKTDQAKMANKCDQQTFQKEIIHDFYNDINDYEAFIESSQLSLNPIAFKSFCYLLDFIFQHNPNLTYKLHHPAFDNISNRLILGNHSLRQLNIVNPNNIKGQYSSVERLINKCITPMGRRSFKDKILHPVTDIKYLNKEYDIIDYVKHNYDKFEFLRQKFKTIKDIEHLYRKIIFNKITPYDLYIFNQNLHTIIEINDYLKKDKDIQIYIKNNINTNIESVCEKLIGVLERNLNMHICENLTFNKFDINFFNKGINSVLDEVSDEFDAVEKEKNDTLNFLTWLCISQSVNFRGAPIKVHFTDKSGMYFHTTDKRSKNIQIAIERFCDARKGAVNEFSEGPGACPPRGAPSTDFLKSIKFVSGGVSNNKKLMGTSLKNLYNKFIQKQDNLKEILKNVYTEFIISLRNYNNEMNDFVKYISHLDILVTKAYISRKYNYCKPIIKKSKKAFIIAKDIRHPLIEQIQHNEVYVPNDIEIGKNPNGILIYGTNGVGKSCINRSVGIATIMAQSGMFVPCSSFVYNPYTAIYTRILGNDNIFKGLSTFAVEMCEMATITNLCDQNSLVLGDEVCSGTETASAIAIFVQTLIHLNKRKCSHIFATHFHQITNMKEIKSMKKLAIKHMSVVCNNGVLFYTRKLEDGPGADMYGLEVCKSFDFSNEFLEGAHKIREKYNSKNISGLKRKKSKYNAKKIKGNCEFCDAEGIDIHHLEPQEKANVNQFIKTFHKNHPANLSNICKICHKKFTKNKIVHRKTKTTKGYKLVQQ